MVHQEKQTIVPSLQQGAQLTRPGIQYTVVVFTSILGRAFCPAHVGS